MEPGLQAVFPRIISRPQTFCRAEESSGKRAAKLAQSQSELAAWATHRRDKEKLLDLARVSTRNKKGNCLRDMTRKLQLHGLMLGVPVTWIPDDTRCNHCNVLCFIEFANSFVNETYGTLADGPIKVHQVRRKGRTGNQVLKPHPMLLAVDFAKVLLSGQWAPKLLAGHHLADKDAWSKAFRDFWCKYQSVNGAHPVFNDHAEELSVCIPVLLHGDEGVGHRRRPVLQLSWGPMLSIGGGSWDRLFLMTTCPCKLYAHLNKGNEAGNRILDRLFDEMARSLRRAYWAGITVSDVTFHLVPLGLSGDHIFQTKAYRCIRHHTCNEICPHCLANVSDVPFEHIHMTATWTQTVFKCVPWTKTPPFAAIPGGDEPSFIQFDLMHVLPHGCGRTFIASVICMMVGPLGLFGPTSKQTSRATRLHEAFTSFSSYCEAHGLHPRDMQEFTIDNLGWETLASFPDCSCKAMDCVMMFQWCIDLLSSVPFEKNDALDWAYAGCCGFDDFNRLCYCSEDRIFWTREEAKQGYAHLQKFLKAYRALAFHWHQHSWTLFNIVPKFHFAAHWLWSLHEFLQSDRMWCLNPGAFGTPMMEGFVGYTSRISRTTHPSAVAIGTIRKYLVEVRKAWLSNG